METNSSYFTLANSSLLRNRSREFQTIVHSMYEKNFHQTFRKKPQPIQQHSYFMQSARQILLEDIQNAYLMLEKVSKLLRKKSLFDNSSNKVDSVCIQLNTNIPSIKEKIRDLDDKRKLSNHGNNKDLLWKQTVISLEKHLKNISTEFRDILDIRNKNMAFLSDRRRELSDFRFDPRYSWQGFPQGSVLVADEKASLVKVASSSPNNITIPTEANRYDQTQMLVETDQTSEYLSSRLEEVQHIERTIVEMGQITQQMGGLIQDQGETMVRIEMNIDETDINIESGNKELLKKLSSVSSNRGLLVKFFAVIVFLGLLCIVVK
ncbi:syntaxin-5-like [Artemia franciscana]|uniref:syntaxin-5-like n=1 Tax=Artemia franciscana TaxID=6661 RepID=UPI0032DB200A